MSSTSLEILLGACAARLGSDELTEENEIVRPWRYRSGLRVNREGRALLRLHGADEGRAIADRLQLDDRGGAGLQTVGATAFLLVGVGCCIAGGGWWIAATYAFLAAVGLIVDAARHP